MYTSEFQAAFKFAVTFFLLLKLSNNDKFSPRLYKKNVLLEITFSTSEEYLKEN